MCFRYKSQYMFVCNLRVQYVFKIHFRVYRFVLYPGNQYVLMEFREYVCVCNSRDQCFTESLRRVFVCNSGDRY